MISSKLHDTLHATRRLAALGAAALLAMLPVGALAQSFNLEGNYIFLPVDNTGADGNANYGRFVREDIMSGGRYNPAGGATWGTVNDFWYPAAPTANYSISIAGAIPSVRANGVGWSSGLPTVTNLSSGSFNTVRISGYPYFNGASLPASTIQVYYERTATFHDDWEYIQIDHVLRNEGTVASPVIKTVDSVDGDQGFEQTGWTRLGTYNDVFPNSSPTHARSWIETPTYPRGLSMAIVSFAPGRVLSIESATGVTNPDDVLLSPADPEGIEANLSMNCAFNHGTLDPGEEITWTVYYVFNDSEFAVRNFIGPTAYAKDVTVSIGPGGTVNVPASSVNDNSTVFDIPGVFTLSESDFDCSELGANPVTLTVTDAGGRTSTATATITVLDTTAPTAVCQNVTLALGPGGITTISPAAINNGSSDNCGTAFSVSPTSVSGLGAFPGVVLTVTDPSGNTSTCSATVTVTDQTPPTVTGQNITVNLLGPTGTFTITPASVIATESDNVGITTRTVSQTDFDCTDLGPNVVTITVGDAAGNTATATATVTVRDNTPPTAVCAPLTVNIDATGNASITGASIDGGSTDTFCGITSRTASPNAFTGASLALSPISVTLTVTDAGGNTATCTTNVTVNDIIAPTAIAQNITVDLNAAGSVTITPAQINNGSTDNSTLTGGPAPTLGLDVTSFDCADIATNPNPVVLTVTDSRGNTATAAATVTVRDVTAPNAICQNITLSLNASGIAAFSTPSSLNNGSTDACGPLTHAASRATSPADLATINWATDSSQNGASSGTLAGVAATLAGFDGAGAGGTAATDASLATRAFINGVTGVGGASFSTRYAILDVTATAGQANHTISFASPIHNPVISLWRYSQTNMVVDLPDGLSVSVADSNGGVTTLSGNRFQLTGGANSDGNGISIQITGSVTAIPFNVLSTSGNQTIRTTVGTTFRNAPFDYLGSQLGANTAVLQVSDGAGNVGTCNATVTVNDLIPPTFTSQDITVSIGPGGTVTVTPTTNGLTSALNDNSTLTGAPAPTITINGGPSVTYNCSQIGPQVVTLLATDSSGNTTTSTQTVTVEDNGDPTAVCQDVTVFLSSPTLTPLAVDGGSFDACGSIATRTLSQTSFDCSDVGFVNVTLTVFDSSGNTDTCTATVEVIDDIAPTAVCQPITITLASPGTATISAADIDNGSSDNCGASPSLSIDIDTFDCTMLGSNNVELTVTDASGNVSTCNTTVTVQDGGFCNPPTVVTQNVTVILNGSGNGSTTPAAVDNGSSDPEGGPVTLSLDITNFDCSDTAAAVTVTLTVEDASGLTSTGTALVTVLDTANPVLVGCPSNTTLTNDFNACGATVSFPTPTATDNCSAVVSLTGGLPSGSLFPVGTTTVTFTATDPSGNTDTCSFDVTIDDAQQPTITGCPAPISVNNDAGLCSAIVTFPTPGVTDNCPGATISQTAGLASGAAFPAGTNTVVFTAEDAAGNTSTCSFDVTVNDTEGPTAVCMPATVTLDATGNATLDPADLDGGSLDNCTGSLTYGATQTAFTGASLSLSPITVTLTVTDPGANSSTCTTTVTVNDAIPPTISASDTTVFLDGSGNVTIVTGDFSPVVGDNSTLTGGPAATVSITSTPTAFDCADAGGTFPVTLQATDSSGNTATTSVNVTILETTPPTAVCNNVTVTLDLLLGTGSTTAAILGAGSTDNCAISTITATQTSFTVADLPLSPVAVTVTVTDTSGNSSTCTANVTVQAQPSAPPTAICVGGPLTINLDATGSFTLDPAAFDGGSFDDQGIASLSVSPAVVTCADVGPPEVVTLTVTDTSGQTATCTSSVLVFDIVPPVAVCVPSLTVSINALGFEFLDGSLLDAGSTDACGVGLLEPVPSFFLGPDAGSVIPVQLRVVDIYENESFCTTNVTVQDIIPPVVDAQDITSFLDAAGSVTITAADINVFPPTFPTAPFTPPATGTYDNLWITGGAYPTLLINGQPSITFDCGELNTDQVVTLTATDVFGNSATATATVSVRDIIPPTISCPTNINVNTDLDQPTAVVAFADATGNDNCPPPTITRTGGSASGSAFPIGVSTITYTAEDASGNTTTCSFTITVTDNQAPDVLTQDITVQLDGTGNVVITPSQVDNGSSDNSGLPVTLSLGPGQTDFNCSEVGPNVVTLTVTDAFGNAATGTATVTVQDTIAPNAVCQNITVQLDASGSATITPADIENGSTDNCGVDFPLSTLDVSSFDCSDVGPNPVVMTVYDVNGNSDTCTATVTIEDIIVPTAICQPVTVFLDATGNASTTAAAVDNGSTDNCSLLSLALDDTDFTGADLGPNPVVLTATDVNGNSATCATTVTVDDLIPPTMATQDITVFLDASGNVTITPSDVDAGTTDNSTLTGGPAPVLSLGPGETDFDCADIATNPNVVTLTATDAEGNSATATATVTVIDAVPPTALCQDRTVFLDATGNASVTPAEIDNGSSDACGVDNLALDVTAFTGADLGPNPVLLTIEDVNGNTSTCAATVTVLDVIDPVVLTQDITVFLDSNGDVSIVPADVDGGTTDNSTLTGGSAPVLTLDEQDFDCSEVGPNVVTLTATDSSGNSASATATVTVVDAVPPVALCQNVTVYLGPSGTGTTTAAAVDNGSNDACGIDTLVLSQTLFTGADLGVNPETLTVTDVNGNSSTCSANVTVLDIIPPDAVCQNITVDLTAGGSATITAAQVDGGSTDNVAIQSLAVSPNAFSCANVGPNTVVLTVTDTSGNTDTCTATVLIRDVTPPVAICRDVTVNLNGSGTGTTTPAAVNNGSNDACGIQSLALDVTSFDCADLFVPNPVVLTVTDNNGNTATCGANVTVLDAIPPTFTNCPPYQLTSLIPPGGVLVANTAGGFDFNILGLPPATDFGFDNCLDGLTVDVSPTFVPLGCTTITFTLTDSSGNTSTCDTPVFVGEDYGGCLSIDSLFQQDLTIIEGSTAGTGGQTQLASRRIVIGDTVQNRQQRGVLGYQMTQPCIGIRNAQMRLVVEARAGSIAGLGDLVIEANNPYFGNTAGWEVIDFQSTPDFTPVAVVPNATVAATPIGDAIVVDLDPRSWVLIPTAGNIQYRFRFQNATNGNSTADSIEFGSGGNTAANRHRRSNLVIGEVLLPTQNECGFNPPGFGVDLELDPLPALSVQDGWVIESAQGSEVGLQRDNGNREVRFGDTGLNQQQKGFLGFDTSQLDLLYPGAEIVSAQIEVTRFGVTGNPASLGRIYVQMLCPNQVAYWGLSPVLEQEDFAGCEFIGDATATAPEFPAADGDTVLWTLSPEALAAINRNGSTQFRLVFEQPDNDNNLTDHLGIFSANYFDTEARPKLLLTIRQ
ncbi:MAG: HYR domain-containing protein [Candidatus Sumerlaeia bacterium]|nr:HYR domain-containing protein [Candidatus Sumerlaeia bacterium]